MFVAMAMALAYLAWTLVDRYNSNREFERALECKHQAAPPPDYGSEVKILQFYAAPSVVAKGRQAILCYGVANAKTVRLEPAAEAVWPSLNRCLYVAPQRDTRYTLTAEGADGKRVTESIEIKVRPGASTRP
jgi:hypothetical protein